MKRISAIAVILAGLSLAAEVASARTPIPDKPPQNALIHDFAGVIGDGAERQMESINQDLKNKTEVVIVVVTVPELVDETIDELGLRIGETWGVGDAKTDRGIVVVLSVADRKITIQTGYGVEGYLPDGRVGQLRDEYALPHLRKNDFTTGLFELDRALVAWSAKEFNAEITGAAPPAQRFGRHRYRQSSGSTIGRLILGLLAVVGFIYMGIRHPRALFWILLLLSSGGRGGGYGGGGFGGGGGFSGFGGGGFGGGGASGDF